MAGKEGAVVSECWPLSLRAPSCTASHDVQAGPPLRGPRCGCQGTTPPLQVAGSCAGGAAGRRLSSSRGPRQLRCRPNDARRIGGVRSPPSAESAGRRARLRARGQAPGYLFGRTTGCVRRRARWRRGRWQPLPSGGSCCRMCRGSRGEAPLIRDQGHLAQPQASAPPRLSADRALFFCFATACLPRHPGCLQEGRHLRRGAVLHPAGEDGRLQRRRLHRRGT